MTGATVHERDPASFLDGRERWVWATLEAIGDAVISTDAEGVVTFMNGAAEVLTGWTRGDATGKKIDEILELADPSGQPIEGRVRAAVLQGCSVRVPTPTSLLARAGDRVVDHRVSPVVDATGAVVGGVVILRDVTERTKFERRLAQTEGLASVGTMAAGMVHEINNPLAYVISNVGFCLEGLEEVIESLRRLTVAKPQRTALDGALARLGELTQALDDASEGADRVRRIVADLERFTHVEDGESQIVDVAGILEAAAKLTANALRHHAQLRKDYGRTPLVEANPGQLTQVFTNLLLNAFEAIGHGHAEHHEIRMTTSTDGAGRAVVEIHDTGPGIPADVLPHIFDPFFTTKPSGAGMGLGLSICQRVIVACGGEIAAESVPGHGTTFRVTLPQARGDGGAQSEALQVPGTAPARRARVLVIDDDRAVAASMARLLGLHHAVTTETDPRAALDAIARGELYDVIFCDLMMPNISGIDFYDALTASAPDQARRIVFMTGGAFSPQARGFLEKVPNTSLTKPFTLESIQAIVGLAVAVDVEVVASGPPEEPQG